MMKQFNTSRNKLFNVFQEEFKHVTIPILVCDINSLVFQCNDSFLDMFGYTLEDIQDDKLTTILPSQIKSRHERHVIKYFDDFKNENSTFIKDTYGIAKDESKVNINVHVDLKRYFMDDCNVKQAITQLMRPETSQSNFSWGVVNPSSAFSVVWTVLMIFILLWVLIYLPYNMYIEKTVNLTFNYITDVFFYADIFVNFNTGYYDELREILIMSRKDIAIHQLKNGFFIDLIATIPYDLFVSNNNSEALKMLRALRLSRLAKFSKLFNKERIYKILNRSEDGKVILGFLRNNTGIFQLIQLLLVIFCIAHQYAIIWILLESSQFLVGNINWFNSNVYGVTGEIQSQIYERDCGFLQMIVFQDLISTALGQSRQNQFNNTEFVLNIFWMVVGIGFVSQVIGNSSMYITQMNIRDMDQYNKIQIIDDLEMNKRITEDLKKLLKNSLEQNKYKFTHFSIEELKPQITFEVWKQLQSEIYSDFISSFKLFTEIDLDIISQLNNKISKSNDRQVFKINSIATELHFVCRGKIQMYDTKMNLANEYTPNTILALEDFIEWFLDTYRYNTEFADIISRLEVNNIFARKRDDEFAGSSIKNLLDNSNDEGQELVVRRNFSAVCTPDTQQLILSYKCIIEISEYDKTFIKRLIDQWEKQQEPVSFEEVKQTERDIFMFFNTNKPGLIILGDGMIYMANNAFKSLGFADNLGEHLHSVLKEPNQKAVTITNMRSQHYQYLDLFDQVQCEVDWTEKRQVISQFTQMEENLKDKDGTEVDNYTHDCFIYYFRFDIQSRMFSYQRWFTRFGGFDYKYIDNLESKEFNHRKYMLDLKKSFMILKELKAFLKPDLHKSMFTAIKWKTTANEEEKLLYDEGNAVNPKQGKMIIDLDKLDEEKEFINLDKLLDDSFMIDEILEDNQEEVEKLDLELEEKRESLIENNNSQNSSRKNSQNNQQGKNYNPDKSIDKIYHSWKGESDALRHTISIKEIHLNNIDVNQLDDTVNNINFKETKQNNSTAISNQKQNGDQNLEEIY